MKRQFLSALALLAAIGATAPGCEYSHEMLGEIPGCFDSITLIANITRSGESVDAKEASFRVQFTKVDGSIMDSGEVNRTINSTGPTFASLPLTAKPSLFCPGENFEKLVLQTLTLTQEGKQVEGTVTGYEMPANGYNEPGWNTERPLVIRVNFDLDQAQGNLPIDFTLQH